MPTYFQKKRRKSDSCHNITDITNVERDVLTLNPVERKLYESRMKLKTKLLFQKFNSVRGRNADLLEEKSAVPAKQSLKQHG